MVSLRMGRRTAFVAMVAALTALIGASPAAAHGGVWKQPNAPAFVAAGPRGSSGRVVTGSGSAGSAASTASTGSKGSSSVTGALGGVAFDSWEFWWETNSDRFLKLKQRTELQHTSSGSPGFLTARGLRNTRTGARAILLNLTGTRVVPELLELLEAAEHSDVLASTLIALARSAEGAQRDEVLAHSERLLQHHQLDVRASAALSIGILGTKGASGLLSGVLEANSAGRRAVGGAKPADLVRAYAALSLGLLGDRRSAAALHSAALNLSDGEHEVKGAVFIALGLIGADNAKAQTVQQFLESQVLSPSVDDDLRASAALSLGRLGRRESLPVLLDALANSTTKNAVRRSSAIALGLLAEMSDGVVLDELIKVLESKGDAPARHFALIALGEIGARDTLAERHPDRHAMLVRQFTRELNGRGRSKTHRGWAALASGIYALERPEHRAELSLVLRKVFKRERSPSLKGAFALALGLAGDKPSSPKILAEWSDMKDAGFRGYAALSLGFLQDPHATEHLRAAIEEKGSSSVLRRRAATALGLLRDRDAEAMLIEMLDDAGGPEIYASVTRALGLLGSEASLDSLLELAREEGRQEQVRAFASVALGLVGERTLLPWNEPLRANSNYLTSFVALAEVRDLF